MTFQESGRGYRPVRGGSTNCIYTPNFQWFGIFILDSPYAKSLRR